MATDLIPDDEKIEAEDHEAGPTEAENGTPRKRRRWSDEMATMHDIEKMLNDLKPDSVRHRVKAWLLSKCAEEST